MDGCELHFAPPFRNPGLWSDSPVNTNKLWLEPWFLRCFETRGFRSQPSTVQRPQCSTAGAKTAPSGSQKLSIAPMQAERGKPRKHPPTSSSVFSLGTWFPGCFQGEGGGNIVQMRVSDSGNSRNASGRVCTMFRIHNSSAPTPIRPIRFYQGGC